MDREEVYQYLCVYDKRYPQYRDIVSIHYDQGDEPTPRVDCFCDNCFYGRDKLALEILRLMGNRDIK